MSVSTSPGTCGSNNECSSIASPETFHHHTNTTCPLLPLASSEELADPVALIDARIKVEYIRYFDDDLHKCLLLL